MIIFEYFLSIFLPFYISFSLDLTIVAHDVALGNQI